MQIVFHRFDDLPVYPSFVHIEGAVREHSTMRSAKKEAKRFGYAHTISDSTYYYRGMGMKPLLRPFSLSFLGPYMVIRRESKTKPWNVVGFVLGSCLADAEDQAIQKEMMTRRESLDAYALTRVINKRDAELTKAMHHLVAEFDKKV
jgi:hypothetical protein